jgi:hypothetical protein
VSMPAGGLLRKTHIGDVDTDNQDIDDAPAVGMVRGEEDPVDTDRVRHAQIGLVRQTPALIYRARLKIGSPSPVA